MHKYVAFMESNAFRQGINYYFKKANDSEAEQHIRLLINTDDELMREVNFIWRISRIEEGGEVIIYERRIFPYWLTPDAFDSEEFEEVEKFLKENKIVYCVRTFEQEKEGVDKPVLKTRYGETLIGKEAIVKYFNEDQSRLSPPVEPWDWRSYEKQKEES